MYAVYHGPEGLTRIATADPPLRRRARRGAARGAGWRSSTTRFFDTVTAIVPGQAAAIADRARELGLHARAHRRDRVGVSLSEVTTRAHVARVLAAFGVDEVDIDALDAATPDALPA